MRNIYTILLTLALPFIFFRLLWKSRKERAYRMRLGERLGRYTLRLDECIWVHAVSMGEVIAATPLIKKLKQQYPSIPLVVTTMTPSGANQVAKTLSDIAIHAYIPYDVPFLINGFLNAMKPRIAIIMETELWPNTIVTCREKGIPLCVLNARLSEKSARGYHKISPLISPVLQNIKIIATHGAQDAKHFIGLGANSENVIVTGSIKFDLEIPQDLPIKANTLREKLGADRFIWVAGSTHEGEEEIILAAHKELCVNVPNALLILVPRHPNRFDIIASLCERSFILARHSQPYRANSQVYLGDTMGEMLTFYAAGDVAFVGGSLIVRGGHNILEPAALAKPVLSGPSLYNFTEISELLLASNALLIAKNQQQLAEQLLALAVNSADRQQHGAKAHQVVQKNKGALQKQLHIVEKLLIGDPI